MFLNHTHIKLTKFQKKIIDNSFIFDLYRDSYTDYALNRILDNFVDAQSCEAEKKDTFIEVYKRATIMNDGISIEYRKDVQKVFFIFIYQQKIIYLSRLKLSRVFMNVLAIV